MAVQGFVTSGAVTSWGSGSDFVAKLLTGQGFKSFILRGTGLVNDATRFASTAYFTSKVKATRGARGTMTAYLATPLDGLNGLVTYATNTSAAATLVNAWSMTLTRPVANITPFGNTWETYSVGYVNGTGSYSGWPDDTNPLSAAVLSAEPASATFQLISGGGGKQLAASIITNSLDADVTVNQQPTHSYGFETTGAITTVGTSTAALWTADADGSLLSQLPVKTLTLTAYSGITYVGSAFWTAIRIDCRVGSPIMVSVDFVFTGAVTGLGT